MMDLTQNDDKFVFSRSQKVAAFTVFSSRSSRMHRTFSDSFGDSSELLTECADELLITARKICLKIVKNLFRNRLVAIKTLTVNLLAV